MSYQRRLIPSTSMLLAFDAAARTGSFTHAAKELNLTQGAISRQITALEEQLDIELFQRSGKTVKLSDTGKVYAQEIHSVLQAIRNASLNAITNPLNGTLNLGILPTFGTRWLMPRLPEFLAENPTITVNFVTKLSPFNFHSENLHAAIHYGEPNWPNTESTFLMGEEVIPVCSPELLRNQPVKKPNQMSELPLLHLSTRPDAWDDWLNHNGLQTPEKHGMLFEQFSIITQAAIAGLGAALLPTFLIQSELDSKELVVIWEKPMTSKSGYYLVVPKTNASYQPVAAFKDWLLRLAADENH